MKLTARKAHLLTVLREFQHTGQPHVTALTLHSVVHQGAPLESVYCNGCRSSRMLPEEEPGKWAEAFNQLYCDLRLENGVRQVA